MYVSTNMFNSQFQAATGEMDMFGSQVQGIGQITSNYGQLWYTKGIGYDMNSRLNQPEILPSHGMSYPTSHPNKIGELITGKPYIRMVGSMPGTLKCMKRIVAKQRSHYGPSVSSLLTLTWKNCKILTCQIGLTAISYAESITGWRLVNMLTRLGNPCCLRRKNSADVGI